MSLQHQRHLPCGLRIETRERYRQFAGNFFNLLKARGVDVEYMVKDNEGHGFHNDENKFEFYEAMEQFLVTHLKP